MSVSYTILLIDPLVVKMSTNVKTAPTIAMRMQTVQTFLAPSIAAARRDTLGMVVTVQV